MNTSRTLLTCLLLAAAALPACSSGREYQSGIVERESVHVGLAEFGRDEGRIEYSLIAEPVLSAGSTWSGNHYVNAGGGLLTTVNVPGSAMVLLYPFQYADLTEAGAHPLGIGSGDGDLRVSLGYGLVSLGRHWNVLWLNGFWAGRGDPLFSPPPEAVIAEFDGSTVMGKRTIYRSTIVYL